MARISNGDRPRVASPKEQTAQAAWDKMQAFGFGMMQVPVDAIKYGGLGANWGMNKIGLVNNQQAAATRDRFNAFDNNPIGSAEFNEHRRRMMEENPWSAFAGEVAVPLGVAKGLLKKGTNIVKNNKGSTFFKNRLTGNRVHSDNSYYGIAGGVAVGKEGLEPTLDKYIGGKNE